MGQGILESQPEYIDANGSVPLLVLVAGHALPGLSTVQARVHFTARPIKPYRHRGRADAEDGCGLGNRETSDVAEEKNPS